MHTRSLITTLRQSLSSPDGGRAPLPFLGMFFFGASHRIRAVCHAQTSVILVLEGMKVVYRGDEITRVRAGEGVLLPSCMETTIENCLDVQTGKYAALCLTYDEAMISRVAADARQDDAGEARRLAPQHFVCDALVESSVRHLVEMAAAAPDSERLLNLCREELLLVVAGKTGGLPLVWQAVSSWSSRCSFIVGLDPGREWTAEGLAERLGTSERSLRRHLNGEGAGFAKILREVRLNTGLAMLQEGRTSVGEAAYRCGYNSASRFAGLFKERFGVSPSDVLQYNVISGQPLAGS